MSNLGEFSRVEQLQSDKERHERDYYALAEQLEHVKKQLQAVTEERDRLQAYFDAASKIGETCSQAIQPKTYETKGAK